MTLPRNYKSERAKKKSGNGAGCSETALEIPMPQDLRDKAFAVCEVLGISIQTAISMFLKRMVLVDDFPFAATLPKRIYKCERAVRAMKDRAISTDSARMQDPSSGHSCMRD